MRTHTWCPELAFGELPVRVRPYAAGGDHGPGESRTVMPAAVPRCPRCGSRAELCSRARTGHCDDTGLLARRALAGAA